MQTPKAIQNFPANYRAEEMQILARWLRAGESGSVVGLVGCGRTNLLDFLCFRPEVLQTYLPLDSASVAVIPVDLNQLPANDAATFYRVILRAFYWVKDNFSASLQQQITTLYLENWQTQDAFVAQSALYEAMFAFQAEQTQVALVLNRFDRFCETAKPRMIATLRGLRDSFKETLCFIVGMRQAAAYLPDRQALGEVYGLIDSQTCWVGPMNDSDSRWVIKQATHTAPQPPNEEEIQTMIDLSGGFPVLLRSLGYWWLNQAVKPPPETWLDLLAGEPSFEYRLKDLWQGLTQEEQLALAAVREGMEQIEAKDNRPEVVEIVQRKLIKQHQAMLLALEAKRVCFQSDTGWRMVSQLWADYIKRLAPAGRGRIYLDKVTGEIYQGLNRLDDLTPSEDKILRFMLEQPPYQRHTYKTLMELLWPGDETRIKNDLFSVIRSLRKKIESNPSEPRYLINRSNQQAYQLYPEGRPE